LAKEFLRFLYREDILKINAEKTQAAMAVKSGADFAKEYMTPSNYENLKMLDEDLLPVFVNFTLTEKTEIKILSEIFGSINSLVNGEMKVEDWVQRLEKANAILREAAVK
ncbi:MAG: carbohydrate ABC transporter substrate-binding protein, partial [Epulopiscium sp.]|nr:carbohydrate ABC transporter substrate-binding protein [Candidatus Epulonipiscium sp.]